MKCEFPNKLPAAVIHENELLAARAKLALIITNYGKCRFETTGKHEWIDFLNNLL